MAESGIRDYQQAKRKAAAIVQQGHGVGTGAPASVEGRLGKEPPRPKRANAVSPTSPRSLFRARNLAVALSAARGELGASANVSALNLYPSEADLIVVDNISRRLVRADADGNLRIGAPQQFSGQLQVVYLWQIRAGVPQRLARQIALRGGVPTRRLDRMVIDVTQHGDTAGWVVYPRASPTRFLALLTGANLLEQGPDGTKRI